MEVSVIGRSTSALCNHKELSFVRSCDDVKAFSGKTGISFDPTRIWKSGSVKFALKAIKSQQEVAAVEAKKEDNFSRTAIKMQTDGVRLYVGMPLDAVSDCNTVTHARAIAAGLKALKLLGVEGVELPVWWGIAEREGMGKYNWTGYLAIAEMVQKVGLKLHVSLCFNACQEPKIQLPEWVSRIGETQPDIFFKDRSGKHYKDCLSFAVDELPVLDGKTPVQVYKEFCESFKEAFSPFIGSTITGITMGLGPNGELSYPSHHKSTEVGKVKAAGGFQCYDKNMLNLLKQHAEASGNSLWGLGGPHDVPAYAQPPYSSAFFKDNGGSWETAYGDFFLSWYSSQLIYHGDRLLSIAASAFSDTTVAVYGRIPLMHSWYRMRSHPSELTAGFYNTSNRDGYDVIAEMFKRNSSKMILPGMDLSDKHQPQDRLSSPESLTAQIFSACAKYEVEVSGQNSSMSQAPEGFDRIKMNLSDESMVNLFTYQRMGAQFFSPEHFLAFTKFVRTLNQPELHSDDLAMEVNEPAEPVTLNVESSNTLLMQTA